MKFARKTQYSLSKFSGKHSKLILFTLIISSLLIFSNVQNWSVIEANEPIFTAQGDSTPWGVHQTFKEDPRFSRVVSWYTNGSTPTEVKFGINASNLNQTVQGSSYVLADYYFHFVELTNLNPDTVYYYRCGSSTNWSQTFQFITAPSLPSRGIHFGALGDCRSNRDRRRAVNNLIINNGSYFGSYPEFMLMSGDLVASGEDMELWRNYALDIENVSANITVMPIVGNHEFGNLWDSLFQENFVLPENGHQEWYYSFSYGFAHITALDSENHGIAPYDVQDINWIKEDLELAAGDPTILWKFVVFHQPPFASASHAERLDIKAQWSPLFEQYDVDIVFNGHNHFYERHYPVNHNNEYNATGDPDYYAPEYPIYVISGAAGMGDMYEQKTRDNPYSAVFNGSSHYVDINITLDLATNTTRLEARVIGINNAGTENYILDSFNITKPIPDAWFSATVPADYNHPVTNKNFFITLSMIISLAGLCVVVLVIIKRHLKYING